MSPRLYLHLVRWEGRGSAGRLAFFVACLALGVAAVVAVAALSTGLEAGIRREARRLLAADLAVSGRRPAPPALDTVLGEMPFAIERVEVREMATVVAVPSLPGEAPGRSQLVQLKVVEGTGYPFYGDLVLSPPRPLDELLEEDSTVVAPDLLARLGLEVGDPLRVGGAEFTIAGVVEEEPDRVDFGLTLGPRVFVSGAGLARADLVRKGSRVEHHVLLALPDAPGEALDDLAARLEATLPSHFGVETYREARPSLRRGLARVDRFLGLVALLSLLVGGIGVAQTVRAWLAGRLDAVAVLKCLGLRPREIVSLYLGQAALLGVIGSLVGIALGTAVVATTPYLLAEILPPNLLDPWQPWAMLRGLALGLGVATLGTAPPLLAVWSVPPARVIRRDAEPLPYQRSVVGAVALGVLGALIAMATVQSGSLRLGAEFVGGLLVVAAALAAVALLLTRLVSRLPAETGRFWVRHGLAALGRPGAATLGAIVALGLGVLVVLAMSLVERRLTDELTARVPEDAPSAFLVDIQPDQWPGVRELLLAEGAEDLRSVPVVTARLAAIGRRDVEELVEPTGEAEDGNGSDRWALTREQRLTTMDELPDDNRIVAGALWDRPGIDEVSIEEDFARDLGVGVGDRLTFDIQGVELPLVVSSIRRVDWSTFGINFFLVVERGVLEGAPGQRLATLRLPAGREQWVQDRLAAAYPNVTFLEVRRILGKIVSVLRKVGLGVRFLGGFTVLAGIAILAGAVSATSVRRGREVALLKTLGLTRRGVVAVFSVEYALVGLTAGCVGATGGAVLAAAVLTRGMDLSYDFEIGPLLVAVGASALLTVTAGLGTSLKALRRRPVEVLRSR